MYFRAKTGTNINIQDLTEQGVTILAILFKFVDYS